MNSLVNALILAVTFIGSNVFAAGKANLMDIKTTSRGKIFIAELKFDQPVSMDAVSTEFINETIQVNIPDGYISQGKRTTQVKDELVKTVFTYQAANDLLRTRVILKKNIAAERMQDSVNVFIDGSTLRIKVQEPEVEKSAASLLDATPVLPQSLKSEIMDEMESTTPTEISKESIAKASESLKPAASIKVQKNEEEKIPVLANVKNKSAASAFPIKKIVIGLIAFAGLAMLVGFLAKGWTKIAKKNIKHSQIKVITQHYLAPRKSLAIIRVAGESILIGVTDHAITPIKTLSLIDEEIPNEIPASFARTLEATEHDELPALPEPQPDRVSVGSSRGIKAYAKRPAVETQDEYSIKGIKELVKEKLKDMRTI